MHVKHEALSNELFKTISFFDVFNQIYKFDISILPVEAEELGINRKYSKLFNK